MLQAAGSERLAQRRLGHVWGMNQGTRGDNSGIEGSVVSAFDQRESSGAAVFVRVCCPWHARGPGVPCLLGSTAPSRVCCAPCVSEPLTRDHGPMAKLQVSRPMRWWATPPSQGGSAGSNPVGATTEHQHNAAADLYERRSAAALYVRRRPVKSGCGRVSVPCARVLPRRRRRQERGQLPADRSPGPAAGRGEEAAV
jgi:hypothetical protein